MSGKKAKRIRRSKVGSKKTVAMCAGLCISTVPMIADGEFLVSVYPHLAKPFGNSNNIEYGVGAGLKLTYRPVNFFNVYAKGDYLSLDIPNVDKVSLIDGGIGIGYHLGISDRLGMDVNIEGGVYNAKMQRSLQSFFAGAQLTFTYKINPIIYTDVNVGGAHYASGSKPLLPINLSLSPGVSFNLTEAFKGSQKLKMQEKSMDPVFPVLYSWYENNPFGKVEITNDEDSSITDVTVSFFQPQYMGQPKVCATYEKMNKNESVDVDLYAFFNEQMLELTEKTNSQAIVTVNYSCLGQKRTKAFPITVPVYGRNNMSWDDDRRAAVFVSSKDPAAMLFAKYVTSIVRDNVRSGVPVNIQYAMGIFETLDQFGLNYVVDPTSAFEDNVGTSSIDFLQFPYQTLMYRGGDCDDLSILVSSLFEAVGIPTAFITIPGHIYMAFDSGLTARQAASEFTSLSDLIVLGNEVWVPLEITLTDEGFNKAWRVGAREWNTANAAGVAAIYKMHDSWQTYQPISVPGANSYFTLPDDGIVTKLFDHSIDEWITKEIDPQIKMYQAKLAVKDDVKTRNNLGVLYGKYGLFIQADNEFKQARRKGYTPSIINTGNVYFSRQNYTLARKWYKSVLKDDPNNELALIGVARCDYELAEYDECDAAYNKVMQLNPDLANEYSYLGSFVYNKGRSFSLADRLTKTIWDAEEDEVSEKTKKIVNTQRPLGENEDALNEVPLSESLVDDIFDFDMSTVAVAPKTLEEDDEDYEHLEEESELEGGDPPPEPEFVDEKPEENGIAEVDLSSFAENYDGLESEVSLDKLADIKHLEKAAEPVIAVTPKVEVKEIPIPEKKVEVKKAAPKPTPVETKVAVVEEKAAPVVIETAPVVTETTPVVTEAAPVETKVAVVEEKTAPVVIEAAPVVTETTPVVTEAAPVETEVAVVEEKAAPVVIETTPVVTEAAPVEEKAAPVVTEVAPVVIETAPVETEVAVVEEKTAPVVTEVAPVVTEVAPVVIETAPVETKVAVVEEKAAPVVTEVAPVVTEAVSVETEVAPVVIETAPVVTEAAPVVTETTPVVEEVAPVETKVAKIEEEIALEEDFTDEEYMEDDFFIEELDLDELLAQEEELNTIPEPIEEVIAKKTEPLEEINVEETTLETALIEPENKEVEPTEIETESESVEVAVTETIIPETISDAPFVPLVAQENVQEEIIPMAVPRFTEQPSAEWAPEEAYVADIIPGMKSFEEEMGEYQNDKSFLYEDEITLNVDPDHDVDEIKAETKPEKMVAMSGIPDVDPFSSYLSKEDAKIVSSITNYSIEKVKEEAKKEAKIIAENTIEAVSDKIETVNNIVEEVAADSIEQIENVIENVTETTKDIIEPIKQEKKKGMGGLIVAAVVALAAVISAVAIKKSKKGKKGDK